MDQMTIRTVEDFMHVGLPTDADAILLIEVDGHPVIVEDDAIFRAVYHHSLRAIDPRIILVECENGYEALQCLLKETPRLIVLDLHMPALDGNDFIQVVKHKPEYAQLPIIVITSDRGERTLQLTDLPNPDFSQNRANLA